MKDPFYAIKLKMFHENAVGGMTIDDHASVLKNGQPIPGLYAAGDTTRGIMIPGDVGVGYIEGVFTALTQAFNEATLPVLLRRNIWDKSEQKNRPCHRLRR